PTDLADYFRAAWDFKHRARLGRPQATLAECAAAANVSPKYLALVWDTLTSATEEFGPIAALQAMWQALPEPSAKADVRGDCAATARRCGTWWFNCEAK